MYLLAISDAPSVRETPTVLGELSEESLSEFIASAVLTEPLKGDFVLDVDYIDGYLSY